MKALGGMVPDERKVAGAALNLLKDKVAYAITARRSLLQEQALDTRLNEHPLQSMLMAFGFGFLASFLMRR